MKEIYTQVKDIYLKDGGPSYQVQLEMNMSTHLPVEITIENSKRNGHVWKMEIPGNIKKKNAQEVGLMYHLYLLLHGRSMCAC